MQIILNAGYLPKRYQHVVAAIGVFDGVHRGHQAVIRAAVAEAQKIGGASVVVTFYPHPVEILHPEQFNGYVISIEQRIQLIGSLGVDVCYVVPFSLSLAAWSAADFVKRILIGQLRTERVIVGEDFSFGSDHQGSKEFFHSFGLELRKVSLLKSNKICIKTRIIKKLVAAGALSRLKAFLGRDYGFDGLVIRGSGIGRRLGFPTANMARENVVTLHSGIYAVHVHLQERTFAGVFYIGTRPTIKEQSGAMVLEVHILDFKGDLYGQRICVDFIKKLRDDHFFLDENSLVRAIKRDIVKARSYC